MEQKPMRLYSAKEISELWHIPLSTIYAAWQNGELKCFKKRGSKRGFMATAEWVNDWINVEAESASENACMLSEASEIAKGLRVG